MLFPLLFGSCVKGSSARLYDLCFEQHEEYPHLSFATHDEPLWGCDRYEGMWSQDWPIEVAAPGSLLEDVRDMAEALNKEIGSEVFTVRLWHIVDQLEDPGPNTTVVFSQSKDVSSLCAKEGREECLALCQYWRIHDTYHAHIIVYSLLLKNSTQRRVVIKHELAHALGLKHSKRGLMKAKVPPNVGMRYLSKEDLKVLREL